MLPILLFLGVLLVSHVLGHAAQARVLLPAAVLFGSWLIWLEVLRGSGLGGN